MSTKILQMTSKIDENLKIFQNYEVMTCSIKTSRARQGPQPGAVRDGVVLRDQGLWTPKIGQNDGSVLFPGALAPLKFT